MLRTSVPDEEADILCKISAELGCYVGIRLNSGEEWIVRLLTECADSGTQRALLVCQVRPKHIGKRRKPMEAHLCNYRIIAECAINYASTVLLLIHFKAAARRKLGLRHRVRTLKVSKWPSESWGVHQRQYRVSVSRSFPTVQVSTSYC